MDNKQKLSTNMLRLSTDNKQLLLLITPVADEVTVNSLSKVFLQSDYTNLKLNLNGIKAAVQSFHRLNSEKERSAELESIAIADRIDAQLSIEFDPLKMTAKAQIITAYGGTAITHEQLKNKMDELKISHGINNNAVTLLLEKSQQAQPGAIYQATIAKGTPVINGTDAIFERLVETPRERLLKPQMLDNGRVDMHNLGKLLTVAPSDQLMRKTPHTEGRPGTSVTGENIKHQPGKDFALEVGANTELSPTDPLLLIASIPGIPKVLNNGMMVDDVLMLANVDVSSGNIDYEGSVIVDGDVCDGMNLVATGDITISGFVESAKIECGGDLNVGKGILGRKTEAGSDNYSCEVSSKGSIIAGFSQYSKINAGLDINIHKQLLHCDVTCEGALNVIDEAGNKGTILGGILRCNHGINTVTLGASVGSKTIIDLVGLYNKLIETKKQVKNDFEETQQKLQHLIDAQRKIDALPASEKKQDLDARLMLTKEEVKSQLAALREAQQKNIADLQLYFENAKVITSKELNSDVSISIGRETFRSARRYGPTKVSVKDHKLSAEPFLK